jgi:hypothetical protein
VGIVGGSGNVGLPSWLTNGGEKYFLAAGSVEFSEIPSQAYKYEAYSTCRGGGGG